MTLALQPVAQATAFGAVSILNATATGIGCSLAIDRVTTAEWLPGPPAAKDDPDSALLHHVRRSAQGLAGWDTALRPVVSCPFPPSRGLKTSSSTAAALLHAAHRAVGQDIAHAELEQMAVDASVAAGVTLTGAFDDQVAVVRGGAHITDNRTRMIVETAATQPWHVAVWVPEAAIAKADVAVLPVAAAVPGARRALKLAQSGNLPAAMTENGRAFLDLYERHGLPVARRPVDVAMAAGALGAGLSGTGPAVAALFPQQVTLEPAVGGKWTWARAVPGP